MTSYVDDACCCRGGRGARGETAGVVATRAIGCTGVGVGGERVGRLGVGWWREVCFHAVAGDSAAAARRAQAPRSALLLPIWPLTRSLESRVPASERPSEGWSLESRVAGLESRVPSIPGRVREPTLRPNLPKSSRYPPKNPGGEPPGPHFGARPSKKGLFGSAAARARGCTPHAESHSLEFGVPAWGLKESRSLDARQSGVSESRSGQRLRVRGQQLRACEPPLLAPQSAAEGVRPRNGLGWVYRWPGGAPRPPRRLTG